MSDRPELSVERDHETPALLHLAAQMFGKIGAAHAPTRPPISPTGTARRSSPRRSPLEFLPMTPDRIRGGREEV